MLVLMRCQSCALGALRRPKMSFDGESQETQSMSELWYDCAMVKF